MMISIRISEKPDSNWNNRLIKSGLGTIYQTKQWAEIVSKKWQKPLFLKFVDNKGAITGQLLITSLSRFENKGNIGKFLKKLPSKKNIYKWTYGPIIFDHKNINNIYKSFSDFLLSENCKVSGSEHPLLAGPVSLLKKIQIKPWSTFLIDLTKSKEELYKNIKKHNGRKNIERSIKRGVIIEEITDKTLVEYQELMDDQRKSQGKERIDFQAGYESWKLLKPLGYSGFLAKKDQKPIGGLLFSFLNDYIIEGGVARSEYDTENNLYSQDHIKWKIIEWGVKNKSNTYDLSGIKLKDRSLKEQGIFQNKKKWGGKLVQYYSFNNII